MAKSKFAVKSMVADELTTVRSEIKTLQARAKMLCQWSRMNVLPLKTL